MGKKKLEHDLLNKSADFRELANLLYEAGVEIGVLRERVKQLEEELARFDDDGK